MAEASISLDQLSVDRLSCPVCLDLLKDPVTIPCGHSFCKVCINDCWDQEDESGVYRRPQCRDTFTPRPVLRRNNMLAEVVEKVKKTEVQAASPAHCYAGPGDVECDFCTGRKHKAVKSCLMCLASFCETHLKPHYEVPGLKKHKLVEASENLEEKICSEHDKVLDINCRTDQSFICYLCTMHKHRGHNTVGAKAERTEKQRWSTSETIFTEMISSMEKRRSEVTELIRAQEKAELSRAERLLEQLEQEIADLQRRVTELEQLSHTDDHIHFLQSFQSLRVSSGREVSSSITVNQHLSFDEVRKSLYYLKKRLEEFCQKEFIKIPEHGERNCPAGKSLLSLQHSKERHQISPKHTDFQISNDYMRGLLDVLRMFSSGTLVSSPSPMTCTVGWLTFPNFPIVCKSECNYTTQWIGTLSSVENTVKCVSTGSVHPGPVQSLRCAHHISQQRAELVIITGSKICFRQRGHRICTPFSE
ncbi:E3 ubiquitin/ISG15 ligase TRIM25 isoform X1 [Ictalurus punctatus]|uniref:E3 ubiquitin/ISG15 ligase TRIM25 isoform X1 n=1 Tax=Ictalurus punctatus TaxID=7998 RepID=A0A9F7RE21_ICTPU|nr:E3 ubiquitin/ISG15 ligase TRIM25 isoform X1 [Ictalurus punctatus]